MTTTELERINGLDTAKVAGFAGSVAENAERGRARWSINTEWTGQTQTSSRIEAFSLGDELIDRPYVIGTDEPSIIGGGDACANPQELLLAAVNACIATSFAAYCSLQGIRINKLSVRSSAEIDLRKFLGLDPDVPAGCTQFDYKIEIDADADAETLAAIHEAVKAASPNYFTLANAVTMNAELVCA